MGAIFFPLKPSKELESAFIRYLRDLYLDTTSGVAYSSPEKILRKIKQDGKYTNIGINRLRRFMGIFDSYTLNRGRHFDKEVHRRYGLQRMNHTIEVDLFTIQRYSKDNDGYVWILAAIDVFSKFGYLIPLKDKQAKTIVIGLKTILSGLEHKVRTIHSDLGKEFVAHQTGGFLKQLGIQQTFAKMSGHCYVVERFIKSMRAIFRAYRLENDTSRFIDKIPELVKLYNNRYHRTLGMSPASVNEYNSLFVTDRIFNSWKDRRPKPFKFRINDVVRIATQKTVFDKHDFNFSTELFNVTHRERRDGVNIYQIEGCGEPIIGYFQESELVSVQKEDAEREIEKIISEKKVNGETFVYVKFRNYPSNKHCNQWIRKRDIINI